MESDIPTNKQIRLAKELQKLCSNYVAPIFFANPPSGSKSKIFKNATLTFVDTGFKKIGITNDHVVSSFLDIKNENPNVRSFIFGKEIKLSDIIIDRSAELDLATLDINEQIISTINKSFILTPSWPPKKAKSNELVIVVGNPSRFRIQNLNYINFGTLQLLETVRSITEKKFL